MKPRRPCSLVMTVVRLFFRLFVASLVLTALWISSAEAEPKDSPDRTTPRRSLELFLNHCREQQFERAMTLLDLSEIPKKEQNSEGPKLAQKLCEIFHRKLTVRAKDFSDEPDGNLADGASTELIGQIALGQETVSISLMRVRAPDGYTRIWLFSKATVSAIGPLFSTYGPHSWEQKLPSVLTQKRVLTLTAWQWTALLVVSLLALGLAHGLSKIFVSLALRVAQRTKTPWDDELVKAGRSPTRLLLFVVLWQLTLTALRYPDGAQAIVDRIAYSLLVVGLAWLMLKLTDVGANFLLAHYVDESNKEEPRHRGIRTQISVMQVLIHVIVVTIAISVLLMQFQVVRTVGMSILASAGIAGIVVGLAAQRSLSGIIAGIQISLTQPVRIGDTIIFENEYGTVERINLTYVVVKCWDERRIVVPITKFLEQPFQNWTREGSAISGPVVLFVDFQTPIDLLRAEAKRICEASTLWDGRTCSLKVTDVGDKTMTVRILVSSADPDSNFDLRCDIREQMMAFLRVLESGKYLPRLRSMPAELPPVDKVEVKNDAEMRGDPPSIEVIASGDEPPQSSIRLPSAKA